MMHDSYARYEIGILSVFINPKDPKYGAKGDGVTDDSAAFNAAITDAISKGFPIVVPPGNYIWNNTVQTSGSVRFFAYGFVMDTNPSNTVNASYGTTITVKGTGVGFQTTGGTPSAMIFSVEFHGIQFIGNPSSTADLIQLTNCTYAMFEKCHLFNHGGHGLHFQGTFDSRIINSDFDKIGDAAGNYSAIYLHSPGGANYAATNSIRIDNCRIENCPGLGIYGNGSINKIYIVNTKVEIHGTTVTPVSFMYGSVAVMMENLQITADGSTGNTLFALANFNQAVGVFGRLILEWLGTGSLNRYVNFTSCNDADLYVYVLDGNTEKISSGSLVMADSNVGTMNVQGQVRSDVWGDPNVTKAIFNRELMTTIPTQGFWKKNEILTNWNSAASGTIGWVNIRQGMAAAAWTGSASHAIGDYIVPTTDNGHVYKCTTAGTTGASQPTWPTGAGATVTDGTVVWTEAGTAALFKTFGTIGA